MRACENCYPSTNWKCNLTSIFRKEEGGVNIQWPIIFFILDTLSGLLNDVVNSKREENTC